MKGLAAMGRLERVVLVVVVAGYVLLAVLLWQGKDFSKNGALSYSHRDQSAQLEALHTTAARVRSDCFRGQQTYGNVVKIVTAEIKGRRLYACYDVKDDGRVQGVQIVDADGLHLTDPHVLKPAGVWPYYAVIKSGNEFVLGGVGLVVLMGFGFFVSTRPRGRPVPPDSPWWGKGPVLAVLAAFIIAGWIVIAVLPRVPRARKARFVMWGVVGWGLAFGFTLFSNANDKHDPWGLAVMSYLAAGTILAVVLGVRARPRLGLNAREDGAGTLPPPVPAAQTGPVEAASTAGLVSVADPSTLPNFSAVGGMDALKGELKDTIGLMLAFTEQADAYRISWNGILLHGRPGTGKTFIAAATAGEFGLNFLHVAAGDLVSSYRGESARNVQAVFKQALSNVPALLFFDEFDSIAQRRDDNPDQEARRTVNQLLQSLEGTRSVRELVVMAATNDLGSLDPAVIRPGRFDRQIQVALPDLSARRSILAAQLRGRPGADGVDVDALAQRMEGLTPAAIAQVVSAASIAAMKESSAASDGALVPLTTDRLVAALKARGGQDRPTVENWTWDRLVLPAKTKAELQEIAALAADPDRAKAYGVQAPSGVLLYGPPGTGKTTVARVLAAQSNCSFYPVSAADLTSKWLGESERLISQLFDRARDNKPSIVFIDEIDAIAGTRGEFSTYDRQVNQLLQEIDGVESTPGVVVVGATNRKDMLDPALLRGGRLSRHVEIPLPDKACRRQMLGLFTAKMPVHGVDLDALAGETDRLSGADIEALCQDAGLQAIIRTGQHDEAQVSSADFAAALADRRKGAGAAPAPAKKDGGYL